MEVTNYSSLKQRKHNSLSLLVFALAISIAHFAWFRPAEEQDLAQPLVGIDTRRQRGLVEGLGAMTALLTLVKILNSPETRKS